MVVAGITDLSFVPPVYWPTVGLVLNTAYERAASGVPGEADPAECVEILPDRGGLVIRAPDVRGTDRVATVVVVDENSSVARSLPGGAEAVLEVIAGR